MLTKDNKEALKSLVKHPWWAVVEKLEEEARIELGNKLIRADLLDPEQISILRDNQTYVKARIDFMKMIQDNLGEVYTPEV